MKRFVVTLLLSLTAAAANAANTQCFADKYDTYIDASLTWYADLTQTTAKVYPELQEVAQWFYEGRKHHFELSRAAVHYYLQNDPAKVATAQPIEAWLKLEQHDVKTLSLRDDALGQLAKATFDDRQSQPHAQNYELRTAFAELLSKPQQFETALNRYNQALTKAEKISCP